MKKISVIVMLAAVMMLFTQCKNDKKSEPKEGETQVENKDAEATAETIAEDEGESAEKLSLPLEFSGEQPTVKDVAIAMGQRFSVDVIGKEEAEMENPGALYEALASAVKDGKAAEGEEMKVDEEKGTVWFKQTDDKEATVIAVKMDGDKVLVDYRCMLDGALNPAQFDGTEVYKVDAAKKTLVYESMAEESLVDEKGELK